MISLLSHLMGVASFSSELALLIGLGVGVDYALFIVVRYRQGLQRGKTIEQAIVDAVDTSGRAVMFAGITVCIALLGMFALGVSFLYGVAVSASVAVLFTVVAALTLLPGAARLLRDEGARPQGTPQARGRRADRRATRPAAGRAGRDTLTRPAGADRRARGGADARVRDPVRLDAPRLRRRRLRPVEQHDAPAPTTCSRRASAPATTARSSSSRRSTARPSRPRSRRSSPPSPRPTASSASARPNVITGAGRQAGRRDRRRLPDRLAAGRIDDRPPAPTPQRGRARREQRQRRRRA